MDQYLWRAQEKSMSATVVNGITCYQSNPRLKAAYNEIEFEPWQIQEIVKCSQDINYFAANYCKIVHVDRGLINFDPYEYQTNMLDTMQNNRFVIMKTGRQMGKCFSINSKVITRKEPKGWFKRLITKLLKGSINEKL